MIAQAVGLGAAVDYVTALGMDEIREHEQELTALRARRAADRSPACASSARATPVDRGATISFALEGIHPHDVAQLLDEQGIAVRAGHHCARPVCVRYGVRRPPARRSASTRRPTRSTRWSRGVEKVQEMFA